MGKRKTSGLSNTPDSLSLQDGLGRLRVLIGTARSPEGSPFMNFYDENGKVRMSFLLDSKGDPYVSLGLESGRQVLSLGASADGGSGITLWNSSGTCFSTIAVEADGCFVHAVGAQMREANEHPKSKRRKKPRTN